MADSGRLDELKRKFEENPKRYFAPLANEYRKAGEPERAIELCRTYLPQQPTHMSGYIVYGQSLHDAGQTEESAAVFKQALTLDPENIIALRHLGDIARDAGDRVGAMRWYGKVLELDPRNDEISAYITSLAQPGTKAFGPPITNERPVPPTIRPEPEPDESAVRLEDIFSEPDVAQAPFVMEETLVEQPEAVEAVFDTQPESTSDSDMAPETSSESESDESAYTDEAFEPFGAANWPTAVDTDTTLESDSQSVLEGPWHPPSEAESDSAEHAEESAPLSLSDFMSEEDAAFAPTAEELGEMPDQAPESNQEPAGQTTAQGATPESAAAPDHAPDHDDSPFITETMAELYLRQGLRAEALAIYRQLVARRDDPALRQRLADIEAEQPAQKTGETVRAFFARIGARRPHERVEMAAQRNSSLSALFGSAQPDANDVSAAQRLSGAFGSPQSGISHS